jgi:hypothetical protein
MKNMNQTYYDEKLESLPENLQYAVMMSNWKDALVAIQSEFKLHIDQTQVLEDCTIKLMFGDIDAPDFISHMFNDAHINSEMAADILLEVDLKILKNIRERLESIKQADEEDEEIEEILLDDDEKEAREESNKYAEFYTEAEKINKETEEQLLKEGILPDGSNITDEMLGITQEIPTDIQKEKDDLLNEINTPTKSFKIEMNPVIETKPIPADHQIENTHLEKPYHNDEIINHSTTQQIPITPVIQTTKKIETKIDMKPEIKKPITINLNDTYREPIE